MCDSNKSRSDQGASGVELRLAFGRQLLGHLHDTARPDPNIRGPGRRAAAIDDDPAPDEKIIHVVHLHP